MKRMTKTAVAFGAAATMLLAGCGSGNGDASGGKDSSELVIWQLTMETEKPAWDALIKGFNEKYPDVKVVTEERAVDAHKDALRQAAGTDSGPDIYRYWAGPGLGGELVSVGSSADITSLYEQYGWEDHLTPPSMANVTQYGGYHGVPLKQSNEAIFYNKALFEQAGITEVPTTYDELVAAAEKLKDAGITPMTLGGTVNWHVMRLLDNLIEESCGPDVADDLTVADGDWSTEACVTDAFTELKRWGDDFLNEGYMGISRDDAVELFYSGDAAMTIEGDWFGPQIVNGGLAAENIGIFPFPGTERAYGFGELMYVTPAGAEKEAAGQFLDYMVSDEGQKILGDAFSVIPVSTTAKVDNTLLVDEWTNLIANSKGLHINNDQNFSTAETTEFWRVQNTVLTGGIDPKDAGTEFQNWRKNNN